MPGKGRSGKECVGVHSYVGGGWGGVGGVHESTKERKGGGVGVEKRKGGRGDVPESFAWSTGNLGSCTRSNLLSESRYTVMCFGKFFTS